jgi:4-amino-4-deoxy-L-arabinose transferase-like glycosyltransferase
MTRDPVRPSRRVGSREAVAVALALLLYWFMAVSVSPRQGVTADEVVHLTGGYTYWTLNDYRMHPENGTLPMRVAALPLLAMDLKFSPLDHPHWLDSKVNLVGLTFFHELGNPVDRMLLAARAMVALFGALTCWITWRWARGLFGRAGGAVALTLAVFCPALLAHGGLATSDIALTACILTALSLAWRLFHRVTWARVAATGVACGLAFLAKMSGVFLLPVLAVLVALRVARGSTLRWELGGRRRVTGRIAILARLLGVGGLIGALSLGVLWAGYGFRYEGFNREVSAARDYYFSWEVILDREPVPQPEDTSLDQLLPTRRPIQETTMTRLIDTLREWRLLPEAYLWGFAHTYKFSRYRPAFFFGEYRTTGWRTFFPATFWLKTTPAALLLGLAGALAWAGARQRGRWLYRAAPLLVFFAFYWVMSINMTLNIGHRHILPTYPVFYVIAAASVLWISRVVTRRAVGAVIAVLLFGHGVESVLARPFYLSYFQPLAGSAKRHHELLVDSSLDWGQGLRDLATWLERKKGAGDATPVFLTYFGADSPRSRGLPVVRFGDELNDHGPRNFPAPVRGGWFVISATHFQRAYLATRGPNWTAAQEALYRTLLERRRAAGEGRPDPARPLVEDLMDLEIMQFSRLTHFLRGREPLEVIGGSLLVFRLSDEEVARALYGPPPASS